MLEWVGGGVVVGGGGYCLGLGLGLVYVLWVVDGYLYVVVVGVYGCCYFVVGVLWCHCLVECLGGYVDVVEDCF